MEVLSRYEPVVSDFDWFETVCQQPLPRLARVNTLKSSVDSVRTALAEEGISSTVSTLHPLLLELDTDSPGGNWPYYLGWLHGQEAVSTIPVTALDPTSGTRVFDACAAPGSKTSHLAQAMNDTGLVVANDNNLGRLSALRANTERLGITNVAVTNLDARHFSLQNWGFDAFDAAIVDAPCSGEGTIRKNPTALHDWTEDFLEGIATLQKDILTRSIRLTRPGGTVVYSTCTFAPEENEAVLDAVLEREDCRITEFDLTFDTDPGVSRWNDHVYDESVCKAKRIWPHRNDTGGFFCAKLTVDG